MARVEIIAEIATAHGGDVELAADMIKAAADAGADTVKLQSYSLARLNPRDPQADWLTKAHLDQAAHERLLTVAQAAGVAFLSTPFDKDSLQMLRALGLTRFKIASSQSGETWWRPQDMDWGTFVVSYPWGRGHEPRDWILPMTAIPLYPTPLECVQQATLLSGYSCHGEGTAAAMWALAQGIKCLEIHMCLPGRSRETKFDKTPENISELRDFADKMATIRTGISQHFVDRWSGQNATQGSGAAQAVSARVPATTAQESMEARMVATEHSSVAAATRMLEGRAKGKIRGYARLYSSAEAEALLVSSPVRPNARAGRRNADSAGK